MKFYTAATACSTGTTGIFLYFLLITTILMTISPSTTVQSAKILTVAFFSSKSHKITYEPLLYELANRGHKVTILGPVVSGKSNLSPNIREILTIDVEKMLQNMPNVFELRERGEEMHFSNVLNLVLESCKLHYDLPQVKNLLATEKFDLILLPAFFNDCVAGYVYKFNTTVILISPVAVPAWVGSYFGNPAPISFIPALFTKFTDKMNFMERFMNLVGDLMFQSVALYFTPLTEQIYREKLNDSSLPGIGTILKNASLILSNSHIGLGFPRPYLPDIGK